MADDNTDDFDIEDHQVLPRLPRNRGITDVTSTPAPYERFLSQQEAPLEQNPRLLAPGDSVRPRALQSLTARQSQSCQTTAARLPTSMPRESKRHRLNLRDLAMVTFEICVRSVAAIHSFMRKLSAC